MTMPRRHTLKDIDEYFQRLSLWSRLRLVGNSIPARATIIIPFVGYLIIFNERLISYSTLSTEIFGQSATVSTRLLAIYFELCFVAFASSLFSCFCPMQVKRYRAAEEYIAGDEPFMSFRAHEYIEASLKAGDDIACSAYQELTERDNTRPTPPDIHEIRLRASQLERV
jgi:hypothetical protein